MCVYLFVCLFVYFSLKLYRNSIEFQYHRVAKQLSLTRAEVNRLTFEFEAKLKKKEVRYDKTNKQQQQQQQTTTTNRIEQSKRCRILFSSGVD